MLAALTGCTGNNSSSSSEDAITSEANSSDSIGSGEGTDTSSAGSDSATADGSSDASVGSSEGTGDASSSTDAASGSRAAAYAEAVLNAVEWPAMEEITDLETAQTLLSTDFSECEDYYLSVNLMSVHLNRIIIAKPYDDSESIDAFEEQLEAYFNYIKEEAAYYPDQEISAAGAVSGITDDGYYYIIVHEDGADAAAAMLAM